MVGIGIVGVGFMGMIHFLAAERLTNAKVRAISTRDPKKLAGDWTGIQGNFGPAGGRMNLTGVHTYTEISDLLADPSVDMVDVCLPTDRHAEVVLQALAAGKHVLVEKPIALTLAEADRMTAAAHNAERLLMVAHVLPYFPDYRFALECVRSGRYGKLIAGHFRRHISPPKWSDAFTGAQRTGGPIIDLHVHDAHFIALTAGVPFAVHSLGVVHDGCVDYVSTNYIYSSGAVLSAASGACSPASRPFTHGYELFFETATLHYEAGGAISVLTAVGKEEPTLNAADPIDAFAAEIGDAVAAVVCGKSPDVLDGKLARDALAICIAEQQSVLSGQTVVVAK